jgi:DNA-directed RNA polymerase specialized sigma24 family protein
MSDQRAAIDAAFRAHHAAVYRYVLRRVERSAVEDIVGETFLVAWRRHEQLAGDPLPWLLGIARRVCANHLRARSRRAALGARLAAQPAPAGAADAPGPGPTAPFSPRLQACATPIARQSCWSRGTASTTTKPQTCSVAASAPPTQRAASASITRRATR